MSSRIQKKDSGARSRVREKVRSRLGASLGEMLVAVLILLLGTSVIAAGISTAVRVHSQMTVKEDAQTLLGTAIASLNDDFASADLNALTAEQKQAMGANSKQNEVTFYSSYRGYTIKISNDSGRGILITPQEKGKGGSTAVTPSQEDSRDIADAVMSLVTQKTMPLHLNTRIKDIYLKQTESGEYAFCYTVDVVNKRNGRTVESETVWVNNLS